MTDDELAALQPGQILVDNGGHEWRVLNRPIYEDGIESHWVRIVSGGYSVKLDYRSRDQYRLKD